MNTETFYIYQLQAIATQAFKQRLDLDGRPQDAILPLNNWQNITRQGLPYPSQLSQLLFGDFNADADLADAILLQLIPTQHPATITEVLGIDRPTQHAPLDWPHVLPWEAMLWHFWQQSGVASFSDWMTGPTRKHILRTYWQAQQVPLDEAKNSLGWQLNILFATAEPPTHASLEAKQQLHAMRDTFKAVHQRDYPTLAVTEHLPNTTIDALIEALGRGTQANPIHVIHLVAHGEVGDDGVGRLVFMDEQGRSMAENTQHIRRAIEDYRARTGMVPFLVVINACFSDGTNFVRVDDSIARSLAATGIPYIVANQFAIKVAEMHSFVHAFYKALALWQPVHHAVMAGRRAILLDHDPEPLAPVERSLPAPYLQRPRLIDTDGGVPGWVVPVLYMRRDMDGHLPTWAPPQFIVWPLDGKVMVRVDFEGDILYVDETPVTESQYNILSAPVGANGPDTTTLDDFRATLDDGQPQTDITPLDMEAYCSRMKKRLLTRDLWQHLVTLDPAYDDNTIYTHTHNAHWQGGRRGPVRAYKNHCYLWDFVGNCFEIVTDLEDGYYKVSSAFTSHTLYAYSRQDLRNKIRPGLSNPHVGFRTMITLGDILRLGRDVPLFRFDE